MEGSCRLGSDAVAVQVANIDLSNLMINNIHEPNEH